MVGHIRSVLVLTLVLAAGQAAWSQAEPSPSASSPAPSVVSMSAGEIRMVAVDEVQRVAIGDPEIVDVTVISSTELMLQAKRAGTTNLIVWDRLGQHASRIEVVDTEAEVLEGELTQLLSQLNLSRVRIKREGGKLFLLGEVDRQEELDRIEQMLSAFEGQVVNLVSVAPEAAAGPAAVTAPLIKLSVQLIELNRSDTEKLGVKWSESTAVTEQPFASRAGAGSTTEALVDTLGESMAKRMGEPFRIGTLFRQGVSATINALIQQNRARILAEPKLVTASGKEASSFIGLEVPTLQAATANETSGSVTASIGFRKTGVLLKMTPTVARDGLITTNLEAEVSSVDTTSGLTVPVGTKTVLVPGFKVRKAVTEVVTRSGETIFIAGLLEAEDSEVVSQVPALGSMPLFGRLFRSPETKSKQNELVIAVTPELVTDQAQTADRALAVEQMLAAAEVTAPVEDPRLRYALQVKDRIAQTLRYPLHEREAGLSGTLTLRLHLFADGTLDRALITSSSGINALDLEALKIAEAQAPYPPFPPQLAERDLWLEIPVIFRP